MKRNCLQAEKLENARILAFYSSPFHFQSFAKNRADSRKIEQSLAQKRKIPSAIYLNPSSPAQAPIKPRIDLCKDHFSRFKPAKNPLTKP
jgi:hypothetical protein